MVLDASLLNTKHKVQIKSKWRNPEKGVVPFPIPWGRRYWKKVPSDSSQQQLANLFIISYLKPYNYVQTIDY